MNDVVHPRSYMYSESGLRGYGLHARWRYPSTGSRDGLLLLCAPIQPREVCLPPDRDDSGKDTAVLKGNVGEVDGCDDGPKLHRVHHADRHCPLNALPDLYKIVACQEGLHPKEVSVEEGREYRLVDNNLGADGEDSRRVVKVARQPHEPVDSQLKCACDARPHQGATSREAHHSKLGIEDMPPIISERPVRSTSYSFPLMRCAERSAKKYMVRDVQI